jgi:hypothetical protein
LNLGITGPTGLISLHSTTPASARKALEERIVNLNREFAGRGRLPWQGKLE